MFVAPSVNKSTWVGALTAVALAGKIGGANCMNTKGREYLITFGCVNSMGCLNDSFILTPVTRDTGNVIGNEASSNTRKNIRLAP
jgi:hypothetical protein